MIIAAKLEMPDFEQALEMKALQWEINQAADQGLEYGRPQLRDIHFTFYNSKLIPYFFEWAKNSNSKRSGKIQYISMDMGKVEYSFSFEDAICSACHVYFNQNEALPLSCEVSLSVNLKKQDLVKGKGEKAKQEESAPLAKEPKITELYYTDIDGSKITDLPIGKVYLMLMTRDAIGDVVDIDLADDKMDFKYNGVVLENDLLQGFSITQDSHKIELETIAQKI